MTRQNKGSDAGDSLMQEIGPGVDIYSKPITANIVLRPYLLTERIVEQTKKLNDEIFDSDIEVVAPDVVLGYTEREHIPTIRKRPSYAFVDFKPSITKTKKLRFIKECFNMRSGKPYNLDTLVQLGKIHESEKELYTFPAGIKDFPYHQVYQYRRVRSAGNKEYLTTHGQIVGISEQGATVAISVDLLTWVCPKIYHERKHIDGSAILPGENISTTDTLQASIIRSDSRNNEVVGTTEFLLEFTRENVTSALRWAHGEIGDPYNGCSLSLHQENHPHGIAVTDTDSFINENFRTLWDRYSKPAATVAGTGLPGVGPVQPYS
jgi:hypothetical protein